ncbi:MAG: S8 family serine peptidase, partial [Pirellulaceae bacterium]
MDVVLGGVFAAELGLWETLVNHPISELDEISSLDLERATSRTQRAEYLRFADGPDPLRPRSRSNPETTERNADARQATERSSDQSGARKRDLRLDWPDSELLAGLDAFSEESWQGIRGGDGEFRSLAIIRGGGSRAGANAVSGVGNGAPATAPAGIKPPGLPGVVQTALPDSNLMFRNISSQPEASNDSDAAASADFDDTVAPDANEADASETGVNAPPPRVVPSESSTFTGQFVVQLKRNASSEKLAKKIGFEHEASYPDNVNLWEIPEQVRAKSKLDRWLDKYSGDPERIARQLARQGKIKDAYPVYDESPPAVHLEVPPPSGGTLQLAGPETDIIAPYQRMEPSPSTFFDGDFVVQIAPGESSEQTASNYGFEHRFAYPAVSENLNVWRIPEEVSRRSELGRWMRRSNENPERIAARLLRENAILDVYPVYQAGSVSKGLANDPLLPSQWHLYNVGQTGGTVGLDGNVQAAWDMGVTGKGVTIGINDTGIDFNHPDLANNYDPLASYDFIAPDDDPAAEANENHATAVAGVAAAEGANGIGISGVAPGARFGALRAGKDATVAQRIEALKWNTSKTGYDASRIDIINNSWGPDDTGALQPLPVTTLDSTKTALAESAANGRGGLGTIYTWAAGNGRAVGDNINYDGYANSRYVIAAGALDHNGRIASYSEPGASLLVSAPSPDASGVGFTTTDRIGANGYSKTDYSSSFGSSFDGTSLAAPYVSGVVALMLEANPNLSWRDVQHILVQSAISDLPDTGFPWGTDTWSVNGGGRSVNHDYGFGLVNAAGAVTLASNWQPVGPELVIDSGVLDNSLPASPFPITIPEDGGLTPAAHSFTMVPNIKVEHVEIQFNATHAKRGQLEVLLTSPQNSTSLLADDRSSDDNADYNDWLFSSSRHWDEPSAGTWTIEVRDKNNGDTTGTFDSWRLLIYGTEITPDTSGPRVAGVTDVNGVLNGGTVSSFRIQFNEPIDPDSIQSTDIRFGPVGGTAIPLSAGPSPVVGTGNRVFEATFATQSATGRYRIDIGVDPNDPITDTMGNALNQDGDRDNGELFDTGGQVPEDKYSEFFTIADPFILDFAAGGALSYNDGETITATLSVSSPAISDLNVISDIDDERARSDLTVTLNAPNVIGNEGPITLISRDTGDTTQDTTNGYVNTALDDQSGNLLPTGITRFTDAYQPAMLNLQGRTVSDVEVQVDVSVDGDPGDGLLGAFVAATSPDGKNVYVAGTFENKLAVFKRDTATGRLTWLERHKDGGSINGLKSLFGVAVSPDGKHVYVAGRGDNAVAWFSRDAADGSLTFGNAVVDNTDLAGAFSVVVSPDNKNVYVGTATADTLVTYTRDATTGALTHRQTLKDNVAGIDGLQQVFSVAISSDGEYVYTAAGDSPG